MIKIKLERASGHPVPWTEKEFNSWDEVMAELLPLSKDDQYYDIMVYPKQEEDGSYTITIHDGYVE